MWITRTSINQPVFATMVMLALVVMGAFSYRLLPVEQMPEINMPLVFISVPYPGASPEAIESDVIKPIENVVNSVDGVQEHQSRRHAKVSRCWRSSFDSKPTSRPLRRRCATRSRRFVRRCRATFAIRRFRARRTTRRRDRSSRSSSHSNTRSIREVSTIVDQQIVKRLQNSPGRRQCLRQRRARTADPGLPASRAVAKLSRRRRPGHRCHSGGEPGLARGQHLHRHSRATGARRGQDQRSARLRADHRREPRRRARLSLASRRHRRRRSRRAVDRARQWPALGVEIDIFKVQQTNIVEVGEGVQAAVEELNALLAAGRAHRDVVVERGLDQRLARSGEGDDSRRRASSRF